MALPAIANAQPAQVAQQPVAEGNLVTREVKDLQSLCLERHTEKGKVIGIVINIATLVAAIWAGIMIGGAGGFFLGCVIYMLGGNMIGSLYHGLRNHEYIDAGNALVSPDFRNFIQRNNLDLSIESIINVHKSYKTYLQRQIQPVGV